MSYSGSLKDLRLGKRSIRLSDEDEHLLTSSLNVLSGVSVSRDKLYAVFNDWKTSRTIAMRRVVVSLSTLIIGSWFIGMDASQFNFLGLSLQNGDEGRFYLSIALLLTIASLLFYIFLYIDKRLRVARVEDVEEMIGVCGGSFDNIKDIAERYKTLPRELVIDFVGENDNVKSDLVGSLVALGFYREHLEKPRKWNKYIDVSEVAFVSMIFSFSLLIILNSII